jgi:hypothetical protein
MSRLARPQFGQPCWRLANVMLFLTIDRSGALTPSRETSSYISLYLWPSHAVAWSQCWLPHTILLATR